ncbi:MAG: NUDIX hydrolase [Pseudarcicella sp.]|nr:NUDIX hydrolase [Pseudarcicella sp.]MBP6410965.1 NUDIX hydrolase [Pseudarcicella sp.]
MIIFIDDRPIRVMTIKKSQSISTTNMDVLIDAQLDVIDSDKLCGHIMIVNVVLSTIDRLFAIIKSSDLLDMQSIVLVCEDKDSIKDHIKSKFKLIKAAGGVIKNTNNEILLMYRLKKWDLPKGKLDKGESSETAAIREVEEECGVKASISDKLCTTYHTYTYKNEYILKQTKWYSMKLIDDSKMQPQAEEDIEKLEWMNQDTMRAAMTKTYSSIRYVLKKYYKQ